MNKLLEEFKNIDKSILKLMKSGIKFSFVFCLFATLFLATYETVHTPILFSIGLFKTSLFFFVAFITYAFAFDSVRKIQHL